MQTKIFVFDFETTGLPPKYRKVNKRNYLQFPRAVQASCMLYDKVAAAVLEEMNELVILDDDVEMTDGAFETHHISKEMTKERGIPSAQVLLRFFEMLKSADVVIAHNLDFDVMILKTEIFHHFKDNARKRGRYLQLIDENIVNKGYCTLKNTIDFCALERPSVYGGTYNKFPKLMELHEKLFGFVPENLHDAKTDCEACLKCYLELMKVESAEKELLESIEKLVIT
jgi:DNA polymerase-3 subunit alpha